jgi:hypothetical protein
LTTLLRYDLTTNPFPLQASPETGNLNQATLTIVVSNPNADPDKNSVTLQGIIISIPVGTDSTDLVGDSSDIHPVPPPGWNQPTSQTQNGNIEYTFGPKAGAAKVGGDALIFAFNVEVNSRPGTVKIEVTEGSSNCVPPDCPTQDIYLTKFPDTWGDVLFWADPPVVDIGGGPTLRWAGPPLATYTITYYTPQAGSVLKIPKAGDPPLANQGQYPTQNDPPLQLTQDTTFYLSVVRTIGKQTYSAYPNVPVTVETHEPKILYFNINADPITPNAPLSFTLTWQLEYVKDFQITADDGQGGQQRTLPVPNNATSWQVSPTQLETTYTLLVTEGASTKAEGEIMQTNQKDVDAGPSAQASAIIQAFPAGTIVAFGGTTSSLPPGWLLCDGTTFDQTKYPDLYTVLGNSNTLPDLRGYFLRGLDPTGNVDPDGKGRSLLSSQTDALKQHQHTYQRTAWFWNETQGGGHYLTPKVAGTDTDDFMGNQPTSNTGDAETRPKNIAVNYLIFAGLTRQSA